MKRRVEVEVESRRVGGESHISHGVAEALGAAADSGAEVVHKERDKEKGNSPHTPLKEKETEKETTGSVSGSRVRVRVGADTFFDPTLDPISVAVAVFGGDRDDRRLWRWYLYRIGEDTFRQLAFTQWRENRSDGMPQNPPACFQRKLTATLNAQSAIGGRDGRWAMGDENSVRNNSQAKAQSAATTPKGGAR
jgi:hypothetical protein